MIKELKSKINKKNIVATILFSAIILVFVFFGFQASGPGMVGYAARVNSKVITLRDLQSATERLAQFYASIMGGQQQNEMMQLQIRSSALNQLIQKEVLIQGAKSSGFSASDVEIADFIRRVPQFQKEGVFQRSAYQSFVQSQGISTSRFEEQIRDDIIFNRFQEMVSESLSPFDSEVAKINKLKEKTYTLEYVNLKNVNFEKYVSVSESEIQEFIQNKDSKLKIELEYNNGRDLYKDKKLEDVQSEIAKRLLKEEHSEKLLADVEKMIAEPSALESALSKYGSKWSKASPVSLDAESVPEIGASDKLLAGLFKLEKPGQMISEMIRTSQGDFIVRLKSIESQKAVDGKSAVSNGQIKNQKSSEFMSQMIDILSKKYSIVRNESLFNTRK